jgi:hypothetical protein
VCVCLIVFCFVFKFLFCCRAEWEREFTTEIFSCCRRREREVVGVAIFYFCFVL